MNATHHFICQEDLINPLTKVGTQVACVLVLAHLFHLALKVFYNSGPVAHILAGLVLSPAGLSRIPEVDEFFSLRSTMEYYPMLLFSFAVLFMFHIGLEVDVSYLMRNLRSALTISCWGLALNFVLGGIVSVLLVNIESVDTEAIVIYSFSMITYLADTSPPAVARVVAEVKLATSNIGRLAICCSLINDLSCIIIFLLIIAVQSWKMMGRGILALIITSESIIFNNYMARWFNRRNRTNKYLRNHEFFIIISHVFIACSIVEFLSFDSTLMCFLMGLLFPREGKSMRTLLDKLTYAMNNFVLPLYFGMIGFQCSIVYFTRWDTIAAIVLLVVLSVFGKMVGTIAACNRLNIPVHEGILIGFLMNLKGHLDIVFLNGISTDKIQWTLRSQDILVACKVIDAVTSGIGIAIYVKKHERKLAEACRALEPLEPKSELRVMGCVYSSRQAAAMVSTISALGGCRKSTPMTPYLMHLIELSQKQKSSTALYHELEQEDELSFEDYGGNDVLEISEVVDTFAAETNIFIHQIKAVSSFVTMYEDVCDHAEDLRISLILLPFHKHQRIDGKLESGRDGVRATNQRVLRHAPCSVGIIISRGPAGVPAFSQILNPETVQEVATLFFGGADDQEALACSKRISTHRFVNLTLIRFLPKTSPSDVGNAINLEDDELYLADFYNMYIKSGKVGYVEKQVNNGKETVEALREIGNKYSLFIVGKGKRGHSPMTTGMSDWEECPELGVVGDVLASPEFNIGGSVLIVQQHRNTNI